MEEFSVVFTTIILFHWFYPPVCLSVVLEKIIATSGSVSMYIVFLAPSLRLCSCNLISTFSSVAFSIFADVFPLCSWFDLFSV